MNELLTLSASELVRLIKAGEVTPLEAVEAHITRIEAVNPAINAVVTPMFEEARETARQATTQLARGKEDLPPLFGLPVTIKDALGVAGVRFTAGTTVYRDRIASTDAAAVQRFKAAGAIILGKTNCPDLSSSVETNNPVFGLTRNPWNLAHSAGGSSGGEGALIAAGGSPLGLGSDIAGSIRIPSAFCGTCGLKPTGGRISTAGHDPEAAGSISRWNTVGPLARRVEDLALALRVLSETPVRDYRAIEMKGRRVIVPPLMFGQPVKKSIKAALQGAVDALRAAGAEVVEGVKIPAFKLAFEIVGIIEKEFTKEARRVLGGGRPLRVLPELAAGWRGQARVSSNVLAMMMYTGFYSQIARWAGYGQWPRLEGLRHQVEDAMGPEGLLLWPVYGTPAPRHGFSWGTYGTPQYTTLVNGLEFPAVALPVGWSAEGLPLGVQVVGRRGADEIVLGAAGVLEEAFGGWRPASTREIS
jgi:Asp-tRNA(Asn)/Glu-tRNA(Gln) amidotransferase A subunit family amidase